MGRKPHPQKAEALRRVEAGEESAAVARELNIKPGTLRQWSKRKAEREAPIVQRHKPPPPPPVKLVPPPPTVPATGDLVAWLEANLSELRRTIHAAEQSKSWAAIASLKRQELVVREKIEEAKEAKVEEEEPDEEWMIEQALGMPDWFWDDPRIIERASG